MMRLPVKIRDKRRLELKAQAVAHVRALVRQIKEERISFWGAPIYFFTKDDAWEQELYSHWAESPDGLLEVCKLAREGDDNAHAVLCARIREYEHAGLVKPAPLASYAAEQTDQRWRRKSKPGAKTSITRDIAIGYLIWDVCWQCGLRPRHGELSRKVKVSGCEIVREALAAEGMPMSAAAIKFIWDRIGKIAFERRIPDKNVSNVFLNSPASTSS